MMGPKKYWEVLASRPYVIRASSSMKLTRKTYPERCCQLDITDPLIDLVRAHNLSDDARLQAEIPARTQSAPKGKPDDPARVGSVRPDEQV